MEVGGLLLKFGWGGLWMVFGATRDVKSGAEGESGFILLEDFIVINRQKHYKYSHDRLEIKDIRCIHQGIERKKGWQPF